MIYSYIAVCNLPYSFRPWAIVVTHMGVVIRIVIIDDSSLVVIGIVVRRASPVVIAVILIHIPWLYKYPPADRAIESKAYARA